MKNKDDQGGHYNKKEAGGDAELKW